MPELVCIEPLEVDLKLHRVRVAGQDIRLGKKERTLLEALVRNVNQTLTYQQLLIEVWGHTYGKDSKYLLHTLVKRLRKKLGDIPPRFIIVVADIGYRFVGANSISLAPPASHVASALSTLTAPPAFPSPTTTPPLPIPPTSFVGREQELAALRVLIQQPDVRLITLSGPGGTGKTRLALEAARTIADVFPDGVVFVALASIANAQMVMWAIMQALGIDEQGEQPAGELLKTALRDKRLLLILDNFERVRAAATDIIALLTAAPALNVLVTSRVVLRVSGEHEFPVPPLALPDEHQARIALHQLSTYPAIALFVDRACAVKPGFRLTEEQAPAVVELCTWLDGLPLAIELVTPHLKLFSPSALVTRLHQSALAWLTDGPQDVAVRHQTMRATIAWSYDLLSPTEQTLFNRIGVFAEGCTIAAVEAICNIAGDLDVFAGMVALVNQSLLHQRQEPDGEPRFFMLETIREYALEQLAAPGERAAIEERYATYYVALVERAELQLAYDPQWVNLLEHEHNNLRAVLEWAIAHARHELGMRMVGFLWRFWHIRGNIAEGRRWFSRVLDNTDALAPAIRAKAFGGAGVLAWAYGRYTEAQHYHEIALQLYREVGDRQGIADTLDSLGQVKVYLRDYKQAMNLFQEGFVIRRKASDLNGIAASLNNLGATTVLQGNYEQARMYFEEGLYISRSMGDIQKTVKVLTNLASVAYHQKRLHHALQLYQESLNINRQLGLKSSLIMCLESVALILESINNLESAAMLFGVAAQLRETAGLLASNQLGELIAQTRDAVRRRLGRAWEEHWDHGRMMTVDQAVSYVVSLSLSDISFSTQECMDEERISSENGTCAHQLQFGNSTR